MSPGSVSAVVEKLIRRLCLGDFPCGYDGRVGLRFLAILCVEWDWWWQLWAADGVSVEAERGGRRRSSGGGGAGAPGAAEMPSLSVASGSRMESSSGVLERAGRARSWAPPRHPGVPLLHHTTHRGKGCERLSFSIRFLLSAP